MRILTFFFIAPLIVCGQGIITTVAGNGGLGNSGNGGPATSANLGNPKGVAVDKAGNIYIADSLFDVVRKVDSSGTISAFAGTGPGGPLGDGGPATSASMHLDGQHLGLAVDSAGNVYITDSGNSRVRKVDTSGTITTFAGSSTNGLGGYSGDGGPAASAQLNNPNGLAIDSAGNLYIADLGNHRIRKVDTTGKISTIAGVGFVTGSDTGDGGPAMAAELSGPTDVAVDNQGNVYIADGEETRVVNSAGVINSAAQANGFGSCTPSPSPVAGIPVNSLGLATDSAGDLFIADYYAGCVHELSNGTVTTVAGGGSNLNGDGGLATDAAFMPVAVAVDGSGNLYIAEGSVVRKVSASGSSTGPTGSVPSISANGIVNGASFQPGLVIGSWATIQGSSFSTTTGEWDVVNGQLPTSVNGVSVNVGPLPAYVYYVSPGQINFIVPGGISTGPQPVTVTNSAGTSAAVNATVGDYGPAFFGWPNNQVVATRQDFSYAVANGTFAGTTTVPAKPGDTIILWGTGFGPTTPPATTGFETTAGVTFNTTTLPTVTVDNVSATVYGAALAPGFAGLYQVAIQVPESLGNGNWTVVATIGGVSSPSGMVLTVQQ